MASNLLISIDIRAIDNASAIFSKLGGTMKSAMQAADQAAKAAGATMQQAGQKVLSLKDRMSAAVDGTARLRAGFGSLIGTAGAAAFGIAGLAGAAVGLGGALINGNASMEQTETAFRTLLKSGSAAQSMLSDIQKFAASTPFEFPELASTARTLLAMGTNAKDIVPMLTDIGDAVSGLGLSSDELGNIAVIFGQMRANGKAATEDLMQLAERGIPVWQILSEQMGKPIPVIRDMVSKGLIPADDAIQKLRAGMHNTFGGGMQAQSQTFNGLLSTLKDNAGAALRAFSGPLFEQAKGGLQKLGDLVASPQFQAFAKDMGEKVGKALGDIANFVVTQLVPGFQRLVEIGSRVVQFFRDNEAALTALKIVGIAIAGAVFAALIAGFIAWAVAAGAAAIATLAATWPILVIGAAIALLIAGIVLLVQHWDEVVKFLTGLWQSFTAWFQGALQAVGNFFVGIWQGIANFFTGIWQGIGAGLQAAWNFILMIVQQALQFLFQLVFGPIIAIAGLFVWLYNHNTYFKALVDAIIGFFQNAFAWLQARWNEIVAWLGNLWLNIVNTAKTYWLLITTAIQFEILKIQRFVTGIWQAVSGWLQARWNEIAGFARAAWQAVSNVFSGIWNNYIAGPLSSLWSRITKWFSDLANQFLNAGKNFISMLVNGITSGAGAVWNAVVSIAQQIWKALGFHSPAEAGPGADADEWMPNLIRMLAGDLRAGAPQMAGAAVEAAAPLRALAAAPGAVSGGNMTISITVNAPGRSREEATEIANMVKSELARMLRGQAITPRYTSGGIR